MWWCLGCGRVRHGPQCKKVCYEAMDEVSPGVFRMRGDMGAERIPPLDGWIYINDDGSCITHLDQYLYDINPCKKGLSPKVTQGPRPPGWFKALKVINERARRILEEGKAAGIVLPCGSD